MSTMHDMYATERLQPVVKRPWIDWTDDAAATALSFIIFFLCCAAILLAIVYSATVNDPIIKTGISPNGTPYCTTRSPAAYPCPVFEAEYKVVK